MDSFSPFVRRRGPRRDEYTLLQDDSDGGSQYSYSTKPSGTGDIAHHSNGHNLLCDKCWLQHTRSKALKRCLDCKQNLCVKCADREQNKRPWWLPDCIAQCMRFIFCYVYVTHDIINLDDWNKEQEHWALNTEASNINRIPRISRDSLRNRQRNTPVMSRNGKQVSNSREQLLDKENDYRIFQDGVARSKSFEDVPTRLRGHTRLPRRSISVEKMNKRLLRERRERNKIYNQNWDGELWEQTRRRAGVRSTHTDKPYVNKVKGKDVDIVISGSEMKLILSNDKESVQGNTKGQNQKEGFFRRKSKTKDADKSYKSYTEEAFCEHPIWFKRDSTKKDKLGSNSREKRLSNKQTGGIGLGNDGFVGIALDDPKPYVVEEPPDQCPICLEDLSRSETRVLTCSHLLHTKCLMHYLRGTDNLDFGIRCPMCNRITDIKNYYAPREVWIREIPVHNQV